MQDITYNVEDYTDCIDELMPLLELHYEEVAMYKDYISLSPDYDKYEELADNGTLHIVTARQGDNLVGYCISFIYPHVHYKEHIYAQNDVLYLDESLRHTGVALDMVEFAEKVLKELGVSVITLHMKTKVPFDNLCYAAGFDYAERVYTKYIGE